MKVPLIVQKIFWSVTWRIHIDEPAIFLTFDDGPHPEVTIPVLEILKSYQAKATFFCVGENIIRYPHVFQTIRNDGHATGNHTFHHLNGWNTGIAEYMMDVTKCEELLKGNTAKQLQENCNESKTSIPALFRPPYGRLTPGQYSKLKSNYSIVMWNVLSKDYDPRTTKEQCYKNVTDHVQSGSIVVFHDSLKAKNRLLFALPKMLDYFSKKNFTFKAITPKIISQLVD